MGLVTFELSIDRWVDLSMAHVNASAFPCPSQADTKLG